MVRYTLNWNLLTNRKQRIVINGTASDWAPVTSGVSQGSVLGRVLFIIYINDIDVGLDNFISNFADDTKIDKSIITDHNRMSLQEDLRKIWEWSIKWEVPFNVNKCHILQVGTTIKKKNKKWMVRNLKTYNEWKTLELQLRLASTFPSNAKMPQVKLIDCWVS